MDRFYIIIIAIENRTMKAVIFATQIVLMLIISSASAQAEFEPGQYQEIIAAAQVDEDAKENSHGIYECIVEYKCDNNNKLNILPYLVYIGMTVQFAYFGASCTDHFSFHVKHISTDWAKRQCDGTTSCSGTVSLHVLTDPYYGCEKDFIVVAECPNGHVVADYLSKAAEGKTFSLRCYTATHE